MTVKRGVVLCGAAALVLSCSRAPAPSIPVPSPGPGAAAAPPPAAGPPGQAAAGAPQRAPLPRDSIDKLRAARIQVMLTQIAGHENEPAEQVYKNVQLLKGITAAELLQKMDEFGHALSWQCGNCHRLNDFAADSGLRNKARARGMLTMLADINTQYLPKIFPTNTPKATCMTCHRGENSPSQTMVPPRAPGQPPAARPPAG